MTSPHQSAAEPTASAWVAANAGSGKTFVLISRLVTLMLSGASPDKLLCLTYTRGAAAEMQGRLFDLLSSWALLEDDELAAEIEIRTGLRVAAPSILARARTLFAQALESPGGLKIQTIHAFCEALLHRFPLEAGLAPGFSLLDEFETAHIVDQVAQEMALSAAAETGPGGAAPTPYNLTADDMADDDLSIADFSDPSALHRAIHRLSRHMPADQFADLAHLLVAARSRFDVHASRSKDGFAAHLKAYLDRILPVRPLGAIAADCEALVTDMQACHAALDAPVRDVGTATDQQKWADLATLTGAGVWSDMGRFFLTQSNQPRKSLLTAKVRGRAPEAVEQLMVYQQRYLVLEGERRIHSSRQMTAMLHHYAGALLARYDAYKERHQRLDYDDLIARVNGLLKDSQAAAWVLFKIDAGLDHILIDEAQDTSPAQWRVIAALAEEFFADTAQRPSPRTIFAVGDEKQSIFSFQGADPDEFDRMRNRFSTLIGEAELRFKEVALEESRRSTPEILKAVDRVFADPAARSGLTSSGGPVGHSAFRATEAGYVEVWPLLRSAPVADDSAPWEIPDDTLAQSARQGLAQRIAEKISSLLANPNISPRDILILVRQRNAFFIDILRALRKARVPIAGADRMKLLEELVIKDIQNAADCALNKTNDLAIAIFLKGPFGNISEAELFDLAHGRAATLYEAIEAHCANGAASIELMAAHQRLEWLIAQCEHLSPFDYFSQFLSVEGGLACLYRRLGGEVDDAIGEFLRLALAFERQYPNSVQVFMDWLSGNATEVKREFEQDVNAVRVMTVHGAKGLEAPIVFVPDGCRVPSRANRSQIAIHGGDLRWQAPQKNMSIFDQQLLRDRLEADFAESQRLLYVALTRARDRLYIGGYLPANMSEPDPRSWYAQLAGLFPVSEDPVEGSIPSSGGEPGGGSDGGSDERDIMWHIGEEDLAGPFPKQGGVDALADLPVPDWLHASAPSPAVNAGSVESGLGDTALGDTALGDTAHDNDVYDDATHDDGAPGGHQLVRPSAVQSKTTLADQSVTALAALYAQQYASATSRGVEAAPIQEKGHQLPVLGREQAIARGVFIHRLLQFISQVPADQQKRVLEWRCREYARTQHLKADDDEQYSGNPSAQAPDLNEKPETSRADKVDDALAGKLADRMVDSMADRMAEQMCAEVMAVLSMPALSPLFSAQAGIEVTLIGRLTGASGAQRAVNGQIDRFIQSTDAIWLADFKTGKPHFKDPAYRAQMAIYRHLITQASGLSNIRCSLIWTQSQEIEEFSDAELDQTFDIIRKTIA